MDFLGFLYDFCFQSFQVVRDVGDFSYAGTVFSGIRFGTLGFPMYFMVQADMIPFIDDYVIWTIMVDNLSFIRLFNFHFLILDL